MIDNEMNEICDIHNNYNNYNILAMHEGQNGEVTDIYSGHYEENVLCKLIFETCYSIYASKCYP